MSSYEFQKLLETPNTNPVKNAMVVPDICPRELEFGELTVDDYENQSSETITSKTTASGVGEEYVFVVKTKTKSMTLVTGECSDGMSDTIYSHHAVMDLGNDTILYGCCTKAK